jgi:hypothetical protein
MEKVLLLGAGSNHDRRIRVDGREDWSGQELITLDIYDGHKVDVLWDLESPDPLPFPDDTFSEIHAYEVLEHIGSQGDYITLFRQFSDYWRVLKPNGVFAATVPDWKRLWAWGDPSHRRIINEGTLAFLRQDEYIRQVGVTSMSDYRGIYKADFSTRQEDMSYVGESFCFTLRAVKPSRCAV